MDTSSTEFEVASAPSPSRARVPAVKSCPSLWVDTELVAREESELQSLQDEVQDLRKRLGSLDRIQPVASRPVSVVADEQEH